MRTAVLIVGLALTGVPPVAAQQSFQGGSSSVDAVDPERDAELDAMTAEIASRFRCLVCRGQSVQESSSQLAREMQALIRTKLEEGDSPEEIEEFFVASYGEFILLKPPAQGLNLVVYLVPAFGFLLAFAAIAVKMRGGSRATKLATADGPSTRSPERPNDPASTLPDDDRAWIEAAIREEV